MEKDACEHCHGERGGVPGNENVINGVMLCDYCDVPWLSLSPDPDVKLKNRVTRLLRLLEMKAPPFIIAKECDLIAQAALMYRLKHLPDEGVTGVPE